MSGPERTMMFTMPATTQGRLVCYEGSVKGRVFPLSSGTFIIGRGETCDMPLKDPGVSRQHAKIVAESDAYILQDLESRNGTFVNGQPMRKTALHEGDVVRICAAAFRFTFVDVRADVLPPEMSLEDHTDPNIGLEDAPTDPHQRPDADGTLPTAPPQRLHPTRVPTVTVSAAAPRPQAQPTGVPDELRTLKIVVVVALTAALIAVTAAVGVVISLRRASHVVVAIDADRKPIVPDVVTPNVVTPDVVKPDVVEPDVVEPDVVEPDAVIAAIKPDAIEPDAIEPKPRPKPKPKPEVKAASEWLAARSGPELVRAPTAGTVTAVAATAVAGQELVVVDGAAVKASATGALSGAVKVGDTVRKGQVLGRIAESRVRVDVPASLVRRAKKGAKVELQLGDGTVQPASIVDVVGTTLFVDAGGARVTSVRLP